MIDLTDYFIGLNSVVVDENQNIFDIKDYKLNFTTDNFLELTVCLLDTSAKVNEKIRDEFYENNSSIAYLYSQKEKLVNITLNLVGFDNNMYAFRLNNISCTHHQKLGDTFEFYFKIFGSTKESNFFIEYIGKPVFE